MTVLMGIIGFILLFIYDYNQIKVHSKLLKPMFTIGFILILVSTILSISLQIKSIIGLIISIIGLAFEIYALFFALDFDDTYVNDKFVVYDKGIYALCRHPGFYGLFLLYLGLYICFQTKELLIIFVIYNILNLLYIIYQDIYIFMILFDDYGRYKKEVPFLIPNINSIRNCLDFWRKK